MVFEKRKNIERSTNHETKEGKKVSHIVKFLDLPFEAEKDFCLLKDKEKSYSYNTFMKKAVAAACSLEERNLWGKAIAVKAAHNADTIVAFLGILLSGNYYVPVSDEAPENFVNKLRQQADFVEDWEFAQEEKEVDIEDYNRLLHKLDLISEDDPMYLIFTSGSTGTPKGIMKSHRNMVSFLQAYKEEFQFGREHILGNQTPFYFDASAKDIYISLYCKCRMVILDSQLFMKPKELIAYMNEEKINRIQWVPSALSIVSVVGTFQLIKPAYLQQVYFVGEVFPVKQLLQWMEALPQTEFINLYGSSEMAGICAFSRLSYEEIKEKEVIPIGKPLGNSEIFLIDEKGAMINEAGVTGEIYVASKAIASGYYKNTEKSEAAFVSCAFGDSKSGNYYRTGDLAQWDEQGRLCFVSRQDDQIKHMGHRIELGEIETAAMEIESVEEACCLFSGGKIILCITGETDKAYTTRQLKEKIPDYMMPNRIQVLEKIPRNRNGKKDKVKLVELVGGRRKTWKK